MRLPLVDRLWNMAASCLSHRVHARFALLASCFMWFAAAPAQAQTTISSISATPNCDAVTGLSVSGGAATITDGNGTLIAWASTGIFIPFEQPSNNTQWTLNGSTTFMPSQYASQCAPPSLTVAGGNFYARIMKGGLGAPPSGAYTVGNAGGSEIDLPATPSFPNGTTPFFTLSALASLGPDASSILTISLNANAFSLPPGRYTASIDFSNAANLSLLTTRQVQLTVVRSVAHDHNGDGFGDIVWEDTSGDMGIWLLKGVAVIGSGGGPFPLPASRTIVGQRDFDGDTKTDLLIRNTNGNTVIWFLNGTQVTPSFVGNIPPNWTVIATGDFDGDGKGDILWRDTNGDVAMWLMNGATAATSAGIGTVPTTWSIIATGDFNGDGTTDLLWQDNAGNVAMWLMNGTQIVSSTGLGAVQPQWQVAGTGDFDGDGNTDLLWRDTSGDTAMWLMNGTTVATSASIGNISPTVWSVAAIGDYNGDGYSDILWRDTGGNTAIWFMDGAIVLQSLALGNIPVNWTVQSAAAE
jgi:FG-GAP-like repeat/FG-GAP repeat